jgi:hypothetical protein
MTLADAAAKEAARLAAERQPVEQAANASSEAYTKAADAWEKVEESTIPVAGELDTVKATYAAAKKKADEATKAAADATSQLESKKAAMTPVQQAATAAEQAVKALPADKELADAAQKFIARAQQLATEATALAKAADEKTKAVAPATDEWNKTKPPVEAAVQKITPLTTTLKEAEKAMLAAREKAEREKEELAALDRRLATAQKVAALPGLKQALVAATEGVPVREAALATAQKQFEEFVAIVPAQEATAKGKADAVAAAAKAIEAAKAEHAKLVEAAAAVAEACKATDAAHQKAPDNAALADATKKIQECAAKAQAEVAEGQKKVDAAVAAHQAADHAFVASQEALAGSLAERARREQTLAAAKTALATAKADLGAKQAALDTARNELNERWANDFTLAALKPLTPEQLCWSVFRVTGVYERYWQTEVAELNKAKPLTEEQKKDPAQLATRDSELEQRTYDKLKGNIATFVAFYGASAGQPQGDFFATADQALFVANGGSINGWVAPAGANGPGR